MKESKLIITDPAGMHARPAGDLVRLVRNYPGCNVTLDNGVRKVSAASILSILSLGLKCGAEVIVRTDGGDEAATLEAVTGFIGSLK